jgi:hypothetical protein
MSGHMVETGENTGISAGFRRKNLLKNSQIEDDKYKQILLLIYNMKLFLYNIRK